MAIDIDMKDTHVPADHTPVPTPEVISPVVALSSQTLTIASLAFAVLLVAREFICLLESMLSQLNNIQYLCHFQEGD